MFEEKSQKSEKASEMDSKLKQNGYRTPESVRRKRTPRMLRGNYFKMICDVINDYFVVDNNCSFDHKIEVKLL
jgi:hypothetical protein